LVLSLCIHHGTAETKGEFGRDKFLVAWGTTEALSKAARRGAKITSASGAALMVTMLALL
jgi:hypothetical protein